MGGQPRLYPPGGGFLAGPTFTAFVVGVPRPQGSMQAIVSKSTGRAFMKQSKTTVEWRNQVVTQVSDEIVRQEWVKLVDCPVYLQVNFYFARPASHSKKQRLGDGHLKHNGSDLDKLVRGIGDALTVAGVYEDDRQIAALSARKLYVDGDDVQQGAAIGVTRMATPSEEFVRASSSGPSKIVSRR